MSSNPNGPEDDWSSASQELFQASRTDHAPSVADRERVRRALAQRMAAATGMPAAASVAGRGARLLKLGFGVSLAVVASLAVTNAVKRGHEANLAPAVQPSSLQPSAAATALAEQAPSAELAAQPPARLHAAPSSSSELAQGQGPDDASQTRAARRARVRAPIATSRPVSHASLPPKTVASDGPVAQTLAQEPRQTTAPASNAARESSVGNAATSPAVQPQTLARAPEPRPAAVEPNSAEVAAELQPTAAVGRSLDTQVDSRADDARAELALLRRIQGALRGADSESVLALCAEHEQRWPHGTFVQEREGLRAIASCTTSEPGASAHARAFLAKYPRTPLGPRVRDACKLQLNLKAAKPNAATASDGPIK